MQQPQHLLGMVPLFPSGGAGAEADSHSLLKTKTVEEAATVIDSLNLAKSQSDACAPELGGAGNQQQLVTVGYFNIYFQFK
jgi:hypothetical protein